ncbi:MAG TPA: DUF1330 domain-containing protein [Paenirhodobacter sp.]
MTDQHKAYWIAHVSIRNADGYQAYRTAAARPIAEHGGRFLVLGGRQATPEGDMHTHTVVVEFPSLTLARACYRSRAYQDTIALRKPYSQVDLSIVEGCEIEAD